MRELLMFLPIAGIVAVFLLVLWIDLVDLTELLEVFRCLRQHSKTGKRHRISAHDLL